MLAALVSVVMPGALARHVGDTDRPRAAAVGSAAVDGAIERDDRRAGNPRGQGEGREMSLDEAVALVQSRFRARAVKAETVNEGGRRVHRIRLLNDEGRVWTVSVDAASGRIR